MIMGTNCDMRTSVIAVTDDAQHLGSGSRCPVSALTLQNPTPYCTGHIMHSLPHQHEFCPSSVKVPQTDRFLCVPDISGPGVDGVPGPKRRTSNQTYFLTDHVRQRADLRLQTTICPARVQRTWSPELCLCLCSSSPTTIEAPRTSATAACIDGSSVLVSTVPRSPLLPP